MLHGIAIQVYKIWNNLPNNTQNVPQWRHLNMTIRKLILKT